MEPNSSQDKAKRAAGVQAIATYLKNGMKIGLGSGTTSRWFIHTLGDRVKQGLEVIGVPTSNLTRDLVTRLGVPLADLNDVGELDLTIDGADEIDANGRMIKGGAANLLWEKSSPVHPRRWSPWSTRVKSFRSLENFRCRLK